MTFVGEALLANFIFSIHNNMHDKWMSRFAYLYGHYCNVLAACQLSGSEIFVRLVEVVVADCISPFDGQLILL